MKLASGALRDVTRYLARLKEETVHGLMTQYFDLFGHPPPRTNDRVWLYFNCAYRFQEKHYKDRKSIPEEVYNRMETWYYTLTLEMEKQVEFKNLKVAELKELCKEHGIKWNTKQRPKIVRELAYHICEAEGATREGTADLMVAGEAVKGSGKGKRGRPRKADNLPGNIKELLELKATASKEDQRAIRRKLRALDPDWKAKYS